jgi:hypothetical protein
MRGSRLRQGSAGATSSLGRRSFSEGGKPAHDGKLLLSRRRLRQFLRSRACRPRWRGDRLKLRDHRIRVEARHSRRQGPGWAAGNPHRNRHRLKTVPGEAHREIVLGGGHADGTGGRAALTRRRAGFGSRRHRLKFDRDRWRSRKETRAARKAGDAARRDGNNGARRDRAPIQADNARRESCREPSQIFSSTGTSCGLTPESARPFTNHSRIWPMPRL